jgi:hypothetical protein
MSEEEIEMCGVCDEELDNCECVYCNSCEEKEEAHEIYQGRCRSCEDRQMVRGIW